MKISFDNIDTLLAFEIHKKCIDDKYESIQISLNPSCATNLAEAVSVQMKGDNKSIPLYNGKIEVSLYDDTKIYYISSVDFSDGEPEYIIDTTTYDLRFVNEIYIARNNPSQKEARYTIMID